MRLLLTTFLILVLKISAFGCFCSPFDLCKHLEIINEDETEFIFMGSYIQEEPLGPYHTAIQFKIMNVYKGEVVKPNSPYYNGEPYTNTDSTVWLLEGGDDSCLRTLTESNTIFALTYNAGWPSPHDSIGYVPTTCKNDYFPISEDLTVTGEIYSDTNITMELADFEELITNGCNPTSTIDITSTISDQINVYPNPISDILNIQFKDNEESWKTTLFDIKGNMLGVLEDSSIDMSGFESGVYFLSFTNGKIATTKKVVKI